MMKTHLNAFNRAFSPVDQPASLLACQPDWQVAYGPVATQKAFNVYWFLLNMRACHIIYVCSMSSLPGWSTGRHSACPTVPTVKRHIKLDVTKTAVLHFVLLV